VLVVLIETAELHCDEYRPRVEEVPSRLIGVGTCSLDVIDAARDRQTDAESSKTPAAAGE
jgi:hypothetical protein